MSAGRTTAASARSTSSQRVRISRVYDEPSARGYRVLVDRLWPRGISKERLEVDEWANDARRPPSCGAGTATSRRASSSSPAGRRPLTLLTATRDVEHSGATVLADYLVARLPKE